MFDYQYITLVCNKLNKNIDVLKDLQHRMVLQIIQNWTAKKITLVCFHFNFLSEKIRISCFVVCMDVIQTYGNVGYKQSVRNELGILVKLIKTTRNRRKLDYHLKVFQLAYV